MRPGPFNQEGILNSTFQVVCVTELQANPRPNVAWRSPRGIFINILDNRRYRSLILRDRIVLEINDFNFLDQGIWECSVEVRASNVLRPSGVAIQEERLGEVVNVRINVSVIGK